MRTTMGRATGMAQPITDPGQSAYYGETLLSASLLPALRLLVIGKRIDNREKPGSIAPGLSCNKSNDNAIFLKL